ncbi:MAG: hypothetical protein ACXVXE_16255 [Nocardioidaceae bacterium]
MRAMFYDRADAGGAALWLEEEGYVAEIWRDPLAGEDDDEDHPWAVDTSAPLEVVEVLVERYDGWLDEGAPDDDPDGSAVAPLDLPDGPRRIKGHFRGA